jgi:tripartite-type tricarboxylate transporter receptor subunit TctC
MNATGVGTSFMTTPGVPPDRVAVLRCAFDQTMKDPDFLAKAERLKLTVNPLGRRRAAKACRRSERPAGGVGR